MAPSRREPQSVVSRAVIAPVEALSVSVVTPRTTTRGDSLPSTIQRPSGTREVAMNAAQTTACRALFVGARCRSDSSSYTVATTTANAAWDRSATTRRSLSRVAVAVTPSPKWNLKRKIDDEKEEELDRKNALLVRTQPSAKRRLLFGRFVDSLDCAPNVQAVYKIVRKVTGNIGGNGYSGPIYGELTMHSMQKMINLMMEYTQLGRDSLVLDVGSGIGKPSLHLAQYPGVAFSCGVEMEHTRWALGMTCLNACLEEAFRQRQENSETPNDGLIQGNTMFLHKNINEAKTFNPFTHVYMFSIGFPPELWIQLSEQWNKSDPAVCRYLICYHGPKDIIDRYEFQVQLLAQTPTSMHGSKEGHMGYVYQRLHRTPHDDQNIQSFARTRSGRFSTTVPCDPLYERSFRLVQEGLVPLRIEVSRQVQQLMGGTTRTTRSRQRDRLTRY